MPDSDLTTGHSAIDDDHAAFLHQRAAILSGPPSAFATGFAALFDHLVAHFTREETLMHACGYPDPHHHAAEHGRILAEMRSFLQQARSGRTLMARAYLADALPGWFATHVRLLDADLAHYARTHPPAP